MIEDPIRTTDSTATLIDHSITNKPDIVGHSGVIPCGISDHDLIFVTRKARVPKLKIPPRVVNARNHKKFDLKAFQLDIQHILFDIIKTVSKDVNDIWLRWKTFFLDILEKHMSITEFRLKANKIPYINAQAKQMIRQRDYLRAKANKTGSNILRQTYNHIRNKVNSTLRKLRKNYYANRIQINEGNLKNIWKVLKEAIGQNDKTCSVDKIVIDDTNQTDKAKITDVFNNHFVSIGEKIANSIEGCDESPIANIQRVPTKIEFQQITAAQIIKVVQRLVNGKATGIHYIPNKVSKDSIHLIAPVLMDILNLSISTKIFPDDLKVLEVVPVYKSGERENLNNYRPIAVLPTIARVFEKLLYRQLYSYLMNNKLLDDRQFGLRSLLSTCSW